MLKKIEVKKNTRTETGALLAGTRSAANGNPIVVTLVEPDPEEEANDTPEPLKPGSIPKRKSALNTRKKLQEIAANGLLKIDVMNNLPHMDGIIKHS